MLSERSSEWKKGQKATVELYDKQRFDGRYKFSNSTISCPMHIRSELYGAQRKPGFVALSYLFQVAGHHEEALCSNLSDLGKIGAPPPRFEWGCFRGEITSNALH